MSVKLRNRKLKSGGNSYYLDIHHNGVRWREFLKIKIYPKDTEKNEKKRIIERIRVTRELELLSDEIGFIPKHIKKLNFFLFADDYVKTYRNRDIKIIDSSLKKFKKFINNSKLSISQISPSVMENYKKYLIHDAGLSGETPHNYFTRFKKILKSAKIKGYIKEMPTEDIRFSNPNKDDTIKKQVLNIDELQKLAGSFCGNENVKRAFLFACYTSLGLAEIRELKWANIRNNRLVINRKKTGELINNRLNPTTSNILGKRGNNDDFIFDIQSISDTAINKNIQNWTNRAKINKHITFYCARHTFACLLLINGANLKTVADAMGHSSTKSTLKYLNYIQKLQDEAIDNLPSINLKNNLMEIV